MEPQNNAYNMCTAVRLSGALDPNLVRKVVNLLVDRHESLRTTFFVESEVPYQHVNPVQSVDFLLVDLEHLSGSKQRERVRAVAAREGSKPFALSSFPLFRTALIRLGPSEYILLLVIHHIISDEWSNTLFFREFTSYVLTLLF